MAQQAINTTAITTERQRDGADLLKQKVIGDLVVGIRVDTLPTNEAERLAADGKFYPLTTDKDGNLRVALPATTIVKTEALEVLREIRDLLIENRDLLLKIA
mgnify:FL=1